MGFLTDYEALLQKVKTSVEEQAASLSRQGPIQQVLDFRISVSSTWDSNLAMWPNIEKGMMPAASNSRRVPGEPRMVSPC